MSLVSKTGHVKEYPTMPCLSSQVYSVKDSVFDFDFVILQSPVQNCVVRLMKTCPIDKNVAWAISSVSVVDNWEFHTLCLPLSLLSMLLCLFFFMP